MVALVKDDDIEIPTEGKCCFWFSGRAGLIVLASFAFVYTCINVGLVIGWKSNGLELPPVVTQHILVIMPIQFVISILAIVGAIKGKANYIFPFVCLQFYVCLSTFIHLIMMIAFEKVDDSPYLPFRHYRWLITTSALFSSFVNFYWFIVAWNHYKYLQFNQWEGLLQKIARTNSDSNNARLMA